MPTFAAIALDSLLEPGSRSPSPKPPPAPPPVRLQRDVKSAASRPPNSASPILYATPEVTPLPDSPSSFPPSPYIINHKRRGPRLSKSFSEPVDVDLKAEAEVSTVLPEVEPEANGGKAEEVVNGSVDCGVKNGDLGKEERGKSAAVSEEDEMDLESDEFLDFQDSMSMTSNSEMDERSVKPSTPMGEYYDAFEEISSDGTARTPSSRNIEDDLREMRLNLLSEIEKRKQSEEALEKLQRQWRALSHQLSHVGLTLSPLQVNMDETGGEPSHDPAEDLCQQVVISRVVADAIGRGCARAEIEMEMEAQIEAKNFEIARLGDRLQYYEAANREMSQRNQEAVEMARQQRHRKKRRQKWIFSSIGLAVTLGAAAMTWYYVPESKPSPRHESETSTSHGD